MSGSGLAWGADGVQAPGGGQEFRGADGVQAPERFVPSPSFRDGPDAKHEAVDKNKEMQTSGGVGVEFYHVTLISFNDTRKVMFFLFPLEINLKHSIANLRNEHFEQDKGNDRPVAPSQTVLPPGAINLLIETSRGRFSHRVAPLPARISHTSLQA